MAAIAAVLKSGSAPLAKMFFERNMKISAQSALSVEYTDWISAESYTPKTCVLYMTQNNVMSRFQ